MATAVATSGTAARPALNRRFEHHFFSGMAILMLGTVLLGFAKTYYFAGLFRAPLPSWVIHVDGFLRVWGQTQEVHFHLWASAAIVLFTAFSRALQS